MTTGAASDEVLENLVTKLDAAIVRGLDDAEASRVKPSTEVFDQLEARMASAADRT